MRYKKSLKELTIKDNFLFGAVMSDEENCRCLLELILATSISRVKVNKEKSIVYHPGYKGIRLDVYARDENNTRYNVEMQTLHKPALGKRARYYHSQIDMELLQAGADYSELPDTYVIFICDFDPFGAGKYVYSFENSCREAKDVKLREGSKSIFLSTRGTNFQEVSQPMVKFLDYVGANLKSSTEDFEDAFVARLQRSVQSVKESRELEERYMLFEEMLRDERAEGKAEGRAKGKAEAVLDILLDILQELGPVSADLKEKILAQSDAEILRSWVKVAIRAQSVEQFEKDIMS